MRSPMLGEPHGSPPLVGQLVRSRGSPHGDVFGAGAFRAMAHGE